MLDDRGHLDIIQRIERMFRVSDGSGDSGASADRDCGGQSSADDEPFAAEVRDDL